MTTIRRFFAQPLAVGALAIAGAIVMACAFADVIAPYDPLAQDLAAANTLPSADHWLGADTLGRDILSRLLHGGQVTLSGALVAVSVFALLGVPLGLMAGFYRGWLDTALSRLVELILATPVMVILLVVLASFSSSLVAAMVTLGVLSFGSVFRVVRGSTWAASQELYVKAARASGLRPRAVVVRHILPNLIGPILVQIFLFTSGAVLAESGLAFLGFSVQPPLPSWGAMIGDAARTLSNNPWQLVPPGVVIGLLVLCLNLVGDGVRDAVLERGVQASHRRTRATGLDIPRREIPDHRDGAILSIRDLAVAIGSGDGEVLVARNVNLDIMPGETLGIVGESGSGKSVIVRAVLGLVPGGGRVVAGSIQFAGEELAGASEETLARYRGRRIGYVPQEPMTTLDPVYTVGSLIEEVVKRHDPMDRKQRRSRALELLSLVRIREPEQVYRKYPHEISGGMAQRVGIALALAGRPQLLIADEPTTALDVTVQQQILDLIRDLQVELGMAVVLVTHDWGVLSRTSDRAVVMYAGEVVEQGPTHDLISFPRHPYTRALLASEPYSARPRERLTAIPGQVPPPADWPVGCHFANRCPLVRQDCQETTIPLLQLNATRTSRCLHVADLAEEVRS